MTEWNQILLEEAYSKEELDEFVVSFASLLKEKEKTRILDLGCGAGRHVICLAKREFEVRGADISKRELSQTGARLRKRIMAAS
jgi:cyclopropane fatty-acyl-phospholipid synthase-like methyltransferase